MVEIQITCPSCNFVHSWEPVDLDASICAPGRCDYCWSPILVVFHPMACNFRHCQMSCENRILNQKIFKVTKFQTRETPIISSEQALQDMLEKIENIEKHYKDVEKK